MLRNHTGTPCAVLLLGHLSPSFCAPLGACASSGCTPEALRQQGALLRVQRAQAAADRACARAATWPAEACDQLVHTSSCLPPTSWSTRAHACAVRRGLRSRVRPGGVEGAPPRHPGALMGLGHLQARQVCMRSPPHSSRRQLGRCACAPHLQLTAPAGLLGHAQVSTTRRAAGPAAGAPAPGSQVPARSCEGGQQVGPSWPHGMHPMEAASCRAHEVCGCPPAPAACGCDGGLLPPVLQGPGFRVWGLA